VLRWDAATISERDVVRRLSNEAYEVASKTYDHTLHMGLGGASLPNGVVHSKETGGRSRPTHQERSAGREPELQQGAKASPRRRPSARAGPGP
jgi:hypothetical protein